jgi:hypothetical protein
MKPSRSRRWSILLTSEKLNQARGAKSLQRAFLPMKINPLSQEPLIG